MIRSLELLSRWRTTPSHHWMAEQTLRRWSHLVAPHHIHLPSLQWGSKYLTALRLSAVWKFKLPQPKMEEPHHHLHMPGRQAPVGKDMHWDSKSGLTEVVVIGPDWAILFYRRWSLGDRLSLGEVQDATFTLSEAISWVSNQAQLNANAVSLWEGQWLIAQAITKQCIEARGPGCPHWYPPALPPFSFHNQDQSPWEGRPQSADKPWEVMRHTHWVSHHEWGHTSQWG